MLGSAKRYLPFIGIYLFASRFDNPEHFRSIFWSDSTCKTQQLTTGNTPERFGNQLSGESEYLVLLFGSKLVELLENSAANRHIVHNGSGLRRQ